MDFSELDLPFPQAQQVALVNDAEVHSATSWIVHSQSVATAMKHNFLATIEVFARCYLLETCFRSGTAPSESRALPAACCTSQGPLRNQLLHAALHFLQGKPVQPASVNANQLHLCSLSRTQPTSLYGHSLVLQANDILPTSLQ